MFQITKNLFKNPNGNIEKNVFVFDILFFFFFFFAKKRYEILL
tara:strand:- start:49895 stop:50023 length:129 start_codon:yes stop_codon:yes gene_type:complete